MSGYPCPTCGAEYSSPWAAEVCGDDDREQDRRNKAWMKNARLGRVPSEYYTRYSGQSG